MKSTGKRVIKNPYQLTNVNFNDNVLSLSTSVCTGTRRFSGSGITVTPTLGRMRIEMSSFTANSIRVRISNHISSVEQNVFVPLKATHATQIEETEDFIIFKSNLLEAYISKGEPFSVDFRYGEKSILKASSNRGGFAYNTPVGDSVKSAESISEVTLISSSEDKFYGLGSTGGSHVLNGRDITCGNKPPIGLENADSVNCPFFVSSRNYGVFVNTNASTDFSFGNKYASGITFSVPGDVIEFVIFASENIPNVISAFTNMFGALPIPEVSAYGTSIKFADDFTATDENLIAFATELIDKGITPSEFWLGLNWLPSNDITGFAFDGTRFPDPQAFVRKIHDKGIRIGLSVNPYISEGSPDFDECLRNGYLLKNKDGNPYLRECPNADGAVAILDLSNNAAKSFFLEHIVVLLKIGIDMFENDFCLGLFDFDDDILLPVGMSTEDFTNYYTYLINNFIFDAVAHAKGTRNTFILSRCGFTGDQVHPFTTIDESSSDLSSIQDIINRSVALGFTGFANVNCDTPLIDPKDSDLLSRWISTVTFLPHARITTGITSNKLTDCSAETLATIALFSKMRNSMIPEIYSVVAETASYSTPSVRPLLFEFPRDRICSTIDNQYMLGSKLMIIPVSDPSGRITAYFPQGIWTNLLTREKVTGPCYKNLSVPANTIPVYVRQNSVIVTRSEMNSDDNLLNNLTFTTFELLDNQICATEIFSADASHSAVINILREGKKITVKTDGLGQNKRIVLSGIKNVVSVSESMPDVNDWGTSIDFTGKEIVITLA